jgi:tRNA (guanine37-N1)-methyltransferase
MQVDIVTIFPEMLHGFFEYGVLKAAHEEDLIQIHLHQLRDYTDDKHRQIDDRPYGGGPGMLLKVEPLHLAILDLKDPGKNARVVLTSAQGKRFDHQLATDLSKSDQLIILCGRYEGVDERILKYVDDEISIGDYVISGGEAAAAVIADAVCRLIPSVVGDEGSVSTDSFYAEPLLGNPQFTRPPEFEGMTVPEVLLSGNHDQIATWRREQALKKTLQNRPDLLKS